MIADCPSCARRWVLPDARVGPGGAVVRCAGCETEFEWYPRRARTALDELDEQDATAPLVTRLAVEELALEGGEALLAAWDRGTLFEHFGAQLGDAWQRCRARLGRDADPAAFREALRARLGIDLPGWTPE